MRVLLTTIGSRGDVQPLVALAWHLKGLGNEVRLCVPPDFQGWIEGLGMSATPLGPEVRSTGNAGVMVVPSTPEQRRRMIELSVAGQFEQLSAVADGVDVILAAGALQIAARSVAEAAGIPYVFAAYCPAVLPSRHHPPPPLSFREDTPESPSSEYPTLWARDAARFNASFGDALNAQRAIRGLPPVSDVRAHIFTDEPWLAADAFLGPWPDPKGEPVFQTGAWILPDERPLSSGLQSFLEAGEPPVYFGFGSMRAPDGLARVMVESARALGRRAIVSRGWAELSLPHAGPDALVIGEANHAALFTRVAAVVHHGGAGTTTAAARAGVPQVVIPQMYDQYYWAARVRDLGIGAVHEGRTPSADSLSRALGDALEHEASTRARVVAAEMHSDGTHAAAVRLLECAFGT